MKERIQNKSGVALIIVICAMFIFAVLGLAMISAASMYASTTNRIHASNQADIAAKTFLSCLDKQLKDPQSKLGRKLIQEFDGNIKWDSSFSGSKVFDWGKTRFDYYWKTGEKKDLTILLPKTVSGDFEIEFEKINQTENNNARLKMIVKYTLNSEICTVNKIYQPNIVFQNSIYKWMGWQESEEQMDENTQ